MFFKPTAIHPLVPIARGLRIDILNAAYKANFAHIGGDLSTLDIIVALYLSDLFNFSKDHFVLSAGHHCLAHYVTLAHLGKFKKEILGTFVEIDSILQGH